MKSRRHPYLDHDGPIVLAHRGFSLSGLENTMAAFAAAVDLGIGYLETDVQVSRDGALLAFHDARLDRISDAHGRICDLTLAQLRGVRVGGVEPIPLLEDVLGTWPDVRVNVDLKVAAAVRPFVDVVRRTKAQSRVCVASFSDLRRRAAIRALDGAGLGAVAWSLGVSGTVAVAGAAQARRLVRHLGGGQGFDWLVEGALQGAVCLQVPPRVGSVPVVTRSLLDAVHAVEAEVHVWTVDTADEMQALLDLGVDGIVTNRSDIARQVLQDRSR